jgi:hypothetical protein
VDNQSGSASSWPDLSVVGVVQISLVNIATNGVLLVALTYAINMLYAHRVRPDLLACLPWPGAGTDGSCGREPSSLMTRNPAVRIGAVFRPSPRTAGMSVASFELRSVEWTLARAALVIAALLTAGIQLALATTTGESIFAVLGLGLLVGFIVFLTDLWEPVLYLVGAIYVGVTTVVWVLAGMPQPLLGAVDKAIQAVLFALFVYVLLGEMRADDTDSSD